MSWLEGSAGNASRQRQREVWEQKGASPAPSHGNLAFFRWGCSLNHTVQGCWVWLEVGRDPSKHFSSLDWCFGIPAPGFILPPSVGVQTGSEHHSRACRYTPLCCGSSQTSRGNHSLLLILCSTDNDSGDPLGLGVASVLIQSCGEGSCSPLSQQLLTHTFLLQWCPNIQHECLILLRTGGGEMWGRRMGLAC